MFFIQGELRHFEAKVKKHEHFQDLADRQENKPRRNKKNVALEENDEIKQKADELGRKVSTKSGRSGQWCKYRKYERVLLESGRKSSRRIRS